MSNYWQEELALVEAAALRIQAREEVAEKLFEEALSRHETERTGVPTLQMQEFTAWMACRHDSDAAWGRWAVVMDARPPA